MAATPPAPARKRKDEHYTTPEARKYQELTVCSTKAKGAAQHEDPNEGRCLIMNALPDVTEACHVIRRATMPSMVHTYELYQLLPY
jgi:hypothetical protein